MFTNVYMLFDNVSQLFIGSPVLLTNDAVAIRSFKELMKDDRFPYKSMASDINLYRLGQMNTATGELKTEKQQLGNLQQMFDLESVKNIKE